MSASSFMLHSTSSLNLCLQIFDVWLTSDCYLLYMSKYFYNWGRLLDLPFSDWSVDSVWSCYFLLCDIGKKSNQWSNGMVPLPKGSALPHCEYNPAASKHPTFSILKTKQHFQIDLISQKGISSEQQANNWLNLAQPSGFCQLAYSCKENKH